MSRACSSLTRRCVDVSARAALFRTATRKAHPITAFRLVPKRTRNRPLAERAEEDGNPRASVGGDRDAPPQRPKTTSEALPYLAKSSECKVLGEGGSFRILSQPGTMQGLPRQTSPSTSDTASDTANPKNFAMLSGLPRHTGAEPAPDAYPCEPAGLPKSRLGILAAFPRAASGSCRPPHES